LSKAIFNSQHSFYSGANDAKANETLTVKIPYNNKEMKHIG